jgi:uncharacterized protein YndB with AHSA1/START domain
MKTTQEQGEGTLVIVREFDAPRELVWRVWTESKHIRNWWGPRDFTSPGAVADARPGGRFHFCMRSPEGQDYWTVGEFVEVVRPERIVWLMYFSDADGNRCKPTDYGIGPDYPEELRDTITFEAIGENRTRLTLRRNTPVAISKQYGEDQGWNESLDKVDAEVGRAGLAEGGPLVLSRVFRAPRELVFRMWTEAEHFSQWFRPKTFTLDRCSMDARPGGRLHFRHRSPGGEDAWILGEFREIAPPERLVFVFGFSNEAGEPVDRPGFPSEAQITVWFEDLGEDTRLTIRHEGLEKDQGEVQGWTETLDRLAERVAAA